MTSSRSERLLGASLDRLPPAPAYWVAYSGGIDSHVLLHLLANRRDALPGSLGAVHVNHQIQQQSGDWEIHCRATCEELGVAFRALKVQGTAQAGESPEATARRARYRGLADWLPQAAVLLTAQHQDDQAETVLLQLLRGAGPRGLAAMPKRMPLGQGWLLRPFLTLRRSDIEHYARLHGLLWVEDPSNTDLRFDRNLLRRQLMPQLQQRWPGASAVLARAAAHQADQLEIADALAALDYAHCATERHACLQAPALATLSAARQRNVLRYWLQQNGLPLPSRVVLERIRSEVLHCRDDATPLVHWPGGELRRYRDDLYVMSPLPPHDSGQRISWQPPQALTLRSAGGVLSAQPGAARGWSLPAAGSRVEVGFRRGGECLQPVGRTHHHRLGQLFQEWGVPTWERDRVPLVYVDGELAAVAGYCIAEAFAAPTRQPAYRLDWSRRDEK